MGSRAKAILWAQFRTVRNHLPRSSKWGVVFSLLIGLIWYGGFVTLAIGAAFLMSSPAELGIVAKILSSALFLAFMYWQVIPVLLVSTGSALETRKLLAYPIPKGELFGLEVLLRVSTGIEVLLVLTGAGIGLLLNPRIPKWAPLALVVYTLFNLFVSAGVRDLMVRLFGRKIIRELMVFVFVIAAASPQLLLITGLGRKIRESLVPLPAVAWPWIAAAQLAQGRANPADFGVLALWTVAAYLFGRWQFERGLLFDAEESSASTAAPLAKSRMEPFYRLPRLFCRDPMAALVEKELRFLTRSTRFRLLFLMGFSFGLLIWLPVAFGGSGSHDGWLARNYLVLISVYALLLLSDALFWNVFGFDRSAAQVYFLVPIRMNTVLAAKNWAAVIFVLAEVTIIAIVCLILRFPVHPLRLLQAYAATLTVCLFLMAVGNLSSTYNPKASDPSKSFRSGAGRQTQAALMFFFPVTLFPVVLAYLARYAFATEWAFAGVLAFCGVLGAVLYSVSMQSAVAAAERRKESIITTLSGGESPIGS
jgi:ABC-2 type transport system permease protein